jgi:putative ABC transport system permease protein
MLKSYLKIAWRNLFRNRMLSVINLTGLSISVAFCLLLFLHIRYEQSFDTFHVNRDRLFRVEMSPLFESVDKKPGKSLFAALTRKADEQHDVGFPLVVGPDMASTFPEVSAYIRFKDRVPQLIRADGSVYHEEQTVYADPSFLTSFSFPLLKGDAKTALASPGNVVLSETTAKKYFGDKDPMGKTIELVSDSVILLKVAGIARDAPANSSLRFSVLIPNKADGDYAENIRERFNQMNHFLVVEFKPGVDEAAFEAKLDRWVKSYFLPGMSGWGLKPEQKANFRFFLRPLADCHYNVSAWGHYTDVKSIYQLMSIVVIILLLASLNYILITIANAASRTQEVGVRKVMGAGRWSIVFQSWLETQLMVGIVVVAGLALAILGLPLLRTVIGSGVTYASVSWGSALVMALALAVVLGVLAGYYPALLISRLKPAATIKSFATFKVNPRFSRVLVVIQFTCCVVLMMGAFVIGRQMHYIQNKDLGFDKEQILMIHNPTWDADFSQRVKGRLFDFARSRSSILAYSDMTGGLTGANNTNGFWLNGEHRWMKQVSVDYNYFELLGIRLVMGRTFSTAYPTDSSSKVRAAVVNESMWKLLGPKARLGVYDTAIRQTIIGVVKDYNFESLSRKIEPEVHRLAKTWVGDYIFRVRAGEMPVTIAALGAEWKTITNNYPYEYSFADESIARMYAADRRWQKAMTASCGFAILIACMGLFGLAAINVVNRTREIGIRKVLGATMRDLLGLLSMGFLRMVFIAILVAAPLAWWIMNRWLEDFAYRIEISWWMFVVVGVVALTIALATVTSQVWRAARANPAEALRSE